MDEELVKALEASFKREGGFSFAEGWWMVHSYSLSMEEIADYIGVKGNQARIEDIPRAICQDDFGRNYFGRGRWECVKAALSHIMEGV